MDGDNPTSILLVLVGPTAVGKTDLAVQWAKQWNTEVISADSRQMYQEMAIGTAKPTVEEMQGVPHHFVDDRSVRQPISAGDFEREAVEKAGDLFTQHQVVVVAGGSGLYVKAMLEGFDEMPDIPPGLREQLNQRLADEGIVSLQEQLKELDPEHYSRMDIQNPQRLVRALEVCLATGEPYTVYRKGKGRGATRPWRSVVVGLDRDREELYDRINLRMDLMLQQGLIGEAEALHPLKHLDPLQTVGYQEIFGWMDGEYDQEEMVRLLKRNSRHYAKRQLTWFRRQHEVKWFHPDQKDEMDTFLQTAVRP
ncbi:MAG TPA: tRNA (adenosine(37)-N6)-dimethylallyltransferase MiaA [Cytophagales bacterium]|nr:tRNA (adenosine(37)-N6)-dimethylallyltransferase MiaA [Cytophagales bacterium]HAP63151.1 tRNA (adenosine(37)-N6)-dimethylallyltransferase MiaA [Cytophagales bacterium]